VTASFLTWHRHGLFSCPERSGFALVRDAEPKQRIHGRYRLYRLSSEEIEILYGADRSIYDLIKLHSSSP
jgi:hypothetical protein